MSRKKHFEKLKDSSSSAHLVIRQVEWAMEIWEINLIEGHACISPDELTWLPLWKIRPKGAPGLQHRNETTKTPGGRNSNTGHGSSKDLQKAPPLMASTLGSLVLGNK